LLKLLIFRRSCECMSFVLNRTLYYFQQARHKSSRIPCSSFLVIDTRRRLRFTSHATHATCIRSRLRPACIYSHWTAYSTHV